MHDPKLVAKDVLAALPAAVREHPAVAQTVLLLADEILRYAAGTLPLAFPMEDRAAMVAMLCADLEGAHLVGDLLPAPTEGSGPRRVLELASGHGFAGFATSRLHPHTQVDVVESDLKRAWFQRRLINMATARNLRVHVGDAQSFADRGAAHDLVVIQHEPIAAAVEQGARFLRPGGALALWVGKPSESALQEAGRRLRLTVFPPRIFQSSVLNGHVLLAGRRPDEPNPVAEAVAASSDENPVAV